MIGVCQESIAFDGPHPPVVVDVVVWIVGD